MISHIFYLEVRSLFIMNGLLFDLLHYFIIYAFVGWCVEVIFAAVTTGKFVNRGFLAGPVCPIYGFGMVIVVFLLTPVAENLILLFIASVILTSALEFVTGYVLEKVFNEKWWDYSELPFNIKGYVCLKFSLMWGIACVFIMKIVHPAIEHGVHLVPHVLSVILLSVSYVLILSDFGLTLATLMKIMKTSKITSEIEEKLRSFSDHLGQGLSDGVTKTMEFTEAKKEEISRISEEKKEELKMLREKLEAQLSGKPILFNTLKNRLYNAFPRLEKRERRHLSSSELLEKIKNSIKNNRS